MRKGDVSNLDTSPLTLAHFVKPWYNVPAVPPYTWQQEGGARMEILLSFLVSVAAGVAAYYICKWLDRHRKGQ